MQEAADYLWKECVILLHGDIFSKCFLKGRSVFGSGLSMLNIREFCFQYGELIFPQWKQSNLKPLGFMNSQALIVFEHTTPNNTLPILWFEKKLPGSGKIWNAIFPRFANARVDRSKRYRQKGYYWLSRLRQIYKSFENDVNVPSRQLLLLVDMLKFVALGKSEPYICQVLCLSAVEYEETVLLGVTHNVFTDERTLTDIGNAIYEEIKKREIIYRSKQDKHNSTTDTDTLQYIPKKFRGMT